MHSVVIIELLGGVGQNLPEDGSHFFRQIASQHHGKEFRRQSDGRK